MLLADSWPVLLLLLVLYEYPGWLTACKGQWVSRQSQDAMTKSPKKWQQCISGDSATAVIQYDSLLSGALAHCKADQNVLTAYKCSHSPQFLSDWLLTPTVVMKAGQDM
jgi:hypothetical protein